MAGQKILKKRGKTVFEQDGRAETAERALFSAREICQARHLRLTGLRFAVLETVWHSEKPAGAYEILNRLKPSFPSAAPISVYRALDFLCENGLIHRLPAEGTFIGCRFPEEEHTPAFIVCSVCGKADEIKADKIAKDLKKNAAETKFKTKRALIELYGVCPSCRK